MSTRELTCIGCPLGCAITVTMDGSTVTAVTGNTCPRGDAYARKEVTNPTRIVTSTVRVNGGIYPMSNVKTGYCRFDYCRCIDRALRFAYYGSG